MLAAGADFGNHHLLLERFGFFFLGGSHCPSLVIVLARVGLVPGFVVMMLRAGILIVIVGVRVVMLVTVAGRVRMTRGFLFVRHG